MSIGNSRWPLSQDEGLVTEEIVDGTQERIQDFKLGGAHLKKLRRAEEGAKIVGVFRVKNHDFMPKKSYFFQF